ncbi:Transglutaminase-like superfamily protein [Verrucomicrobium sp. GAS474]|uniref:transglutaminase-like domain-containing protein n=1 Tax=Verrucomicrobium sp. GAS474 TaxID=1882831 RepID=UPI00087BD7B4|nr:transglutaminase-like domain-containing protein [Verrucomicrobium sp. GAS474]SDT96983.1 Transglutaminase-like superfamily protein [Verrucomicrobium sp. GAS474]
MKPAPRRIPDLGTPPSSSPSPGQGGPGGPNAAILKLLGDDDTSMVHLVMEQLLADSKTALPRIETLLHEADAADASGQAAKELRRALRELRGQERFEALRLRCARIVTLEEFEEFCWHVALCGNPADPTATVDTARSRLDAWAAQVREQLRPQTKAASPLSQLEALRTILAEEGGLRGNADNYYDPKNSFLDRVILSGRGIPISLTAVYLLVGRRAGILVEPIGMPGHFLARIGTLYLDPFHEGLAVDGEALREMVRRSASAADAPEEARHALRALAHPMPLALMARRMVVNLVNIYEEREEEAATEARWRQVLRWIEEGIDPSLRSQEHDRPGSRGHLDEDGNQTESENDSDDDDGDDKEEGDML